MYLLLRYIKVVSNYGKGKTRDRFYIAKKYPISENLFIKLLFYNVGLVHVQIINYKLLHCRITV